MSDAGREDPGHGSAAEPDPSQPRAPTKTSYSGAVLLSGIGTAVTIAFLFAETMVAVRVLEPSDYGLFVLLIATANFFVMATDLGYAFGKIAFELFDLAFDFLQSHAMLGDLFLFNILPRFQLL